MKQRKTKLFGTDGIRKKVGEFPLDDSSILKLGRAFGRRLDPARDTQDSFIVVGMDTRASGPHIARLLAAGITRESPGTRVLNCGVIPTPGLAYIAKHGDAGYGIMITASHNPYTDNGIKFFSGEGEKLPEQVENELEDIFCSLEDTPPDAMPLADLNEQAELREPYIDFLLEHANRPDREDALRIVLDCANGATFQIAPQVFREAGFDCIVTHTQPDGENINRQCGSTHLEHLKETVKSELADIGIAFDGDGDRVLMVDQGGRDIDGDHILLILARFFAHTRLDFAANKTVVGTVMGNLGLEKALEKRGIQYIRTDVGDKYVYRELKKRDAILGGEQSGHTILRCFQETGDGILTALYLLEALAVLDYHPSEVSGLLTKYPQVLINIPIKERKDLETWDELNDMIAEFNKTHEDNSRILIRYSGTEPILRVMMESQYKSVIDDSIGAFETFIRSTIG